MNTYRIKILGLAQKDRPQRCANTSSEEENPERSFFIVEDIV